LVPCELRGEKVPPELRVGDTVDIWSAGGRAEEADRVLLKDCELVWWPRRPQE
jgi:hypothetical protein